MAISSHKLNLHVENVILYILRAADLCYGGRREVASILARVKDQLDEALAKNAYEVTRTNEMAIAAAMLLGIYDRGMFARSRQTITSELVKSTTNVESLNELPAYFMNQMLAVAEQVAVDCDWNLEDQAKYVGVLARQAAVIVEAIDDCD